MIIIIIRGPRMMLSHIHDLKKYKKPVNNQYMSLNSIVNAMNGDGDSVDAASPDESDGDVEMMPQTVDEQTAEVQVSSSEAMATYY